MSKHYSSEKIRELDCTYNIIIGQRSNGKTFDSFLNGVQEYWNKKRQFAVVRRWDEDFTKQRGASMMGGLLCDGNGKNRIAEITNGEYDNIYYYSRRWYLCKYVEDEKRRITDENPFAYGFSLSSMEHDKSTAYPGIYTIIFDEFISRGMYLTDEFVLFMNVISTICRDKEDVQIFMLGNTVNKYCPYFEELGLTNVKKQEPGTIEVYTAGEHGTRIAVEYCKDEKRSKSSSQKYYCFDNPAMKMITDGKWETLWYPHLPVKYSMNDVLYRFFICFKGETLQCEVIQKEYSVFIYIHRKTTPIKEEDTDLVYSLDYDYRTNWRRNITKPTYPVEKKIYDLFRQEKVFYQDNTIGEIVRNYMLCCG